MNAPGFDPTKTYCRFEVPDKFTLIGSIRTVQQTPRSFAVDFVVKPKPSFSSIDTVEATLLKIISENGRFGQVTRTNSTTTVMTVAGFRMDNQSQQLDGGQALEVLGDFGNVIYQALRAELVGDGAP